MMVCPQSVGGLSQRKRETDMEKTKNYANAKDVLPNELFDEVKKHYTGMLYVPDGVRHQDRRKLVIALQNQKTCPREIASIVGLSVRRVTQIISEERDKTRC
jgi:hypothetical protein